MHGLTFAVGDRVKADRYYSSTMDFWNVEGVVESVDKSLVVVKFDDGRVQQFIGYLLELAE